MLTAQYRMLLPPNPLVVITGILTTLNNEFMLLWIRKKYQDEKKGVINLMVFFNECMLLSIIKYISKLLFLGLEKMQYPFCRNLLINEYICFSKYQKSTLRIHLIELLPRWGLCRLDSLIGSYQRIYTIWISKQVGTELGQAQPSWS